MAELYTRIGQLMTKAVAEHLTGSDIDVPHIGRCKIVSVQPPHIHSGNWLFTFDVAFPNSNSNFTLGVSTFGSCLLDDVKKIPLPAPDFEDELEKEFPKEHQEAWFKLHESLEDLLTQLGLKGGSEEGSDFYLIDDYYPSRGISGSLHKPRVVAPNLVKQCQELLKQHSGWDFWIQFDLDFKDTRYKGKNERVLIREDRIVFDWDKQRLEREFTGEFKWPG
jgi:hypothetical protein